MEPSGTTQHQWSFKEFHRHLCLPFRHWRSDSRHQEKKRSAPYPLRRCAKFARTMRTTSTNSGDIQQFQFFHEVSYPPPFLHHGPEYHAPFFPTIQGKVKEILVTSVKNNIHFINPIMKNIGIGMLCGGVLLLVIGFLIGWTHYNTYTLLSLLLVIAGVVIHVVHVKRQSKY